MAAKTEYRLGIYLGLRSVSYVRVKKTLDEWKVLQSGYVRMGKQGVFADGDAENLSTVLQEIVRSNSVGRDAVHVSLHGRYCVSRAAIGDDRQLTTQFDRIENNSQHYLQMGLGETLVGTTQVELPQANGYGQVSLIKRSLIEQLEASLAAANLELDSVEGALPNVCRLAGYANLDMKPLLLVWVSDGGCEIGISYQGRLQLNYHAGSSASVDDAAETLDKHIKRMRRFCDQYQNEGAGDLLQRVLVLAGPKQSKQLEKRLEKFEFERLYTLSDLTKSSLAENLEDEPIHSPGAVSALGGLLVHLDNDTLPMTDLYDNYMNGKPRSILLSIFQDGLLAIAAAALLMVVTAGGWFIERQVAVAEADYEELTDYYILHREEVLALDAARELLHEHQRLVDQCDQGPLDLLLAHIAGCLPDDARVDTLQIDLENRLTLKGTMLFGDRTYEVLKALQAVPQIGEVALESVGHSADFGDSATLFEIQCELTKQPSEIASQLVAVTATGGDIQ